MTILYVSLVIAGAMFAMRFLTWRFDRRMARRIERWERTEMGEELRRLSARGEWPAP